MASLPPRSPEKGLTSATCEVEDLYEAFQLTEVEDGAGTAVLFWDEEVGRVGPS